MTTIVSEVTIDLNGSPKGLRVNPRAAKEIAAHFGNYMEAFNRLAVFDMSAYVAIVAAGLGKKRADVEDDVFHTGLDKLTDKLSEYVGLLLRAGRPADADKDAKSGEA